METPTEEVGRSRTRGYWEEKYCTLGKLWGDAPEAQARRALELFRNHGVGLVLDVGCGYGRVLALFEAAGLVTVGVDLAATGLCMAREALLTNNPVAHLVQGTAARLPFANGTFEGVWSANLLQLLAPGGAAAAAYEMHRVLAPGWVLAVAAFSTSDIDFGKGEHLGSNVYQYRGRTAHYYTGEELTGLLPGYRRLVLEEVTNRHKDPDGGEHTHTLWFFAGLKPKTT